MARGGRAEKIPRPGADRPCTSLQSAAGQAAGRAPERSSIFPPDRSLSSFESSLRAASVHHSVLIGPEREPGKDCTDIQYILFYYSIVYISMEISIRLFRFTQGVANVVFSSYLYIS